MDHSNYDDQVLMGENMPDLGKIEEAIPLIIFNEERRLFEINEEGRQFLSALKGPIGIVAVAGMYRTGKSYLLNRMLLDRSDGFGVGPTINPCTKGVWMWSKPLDGQTPDGDPIQVVIMDTEGLGALDEDSNHDVRIFSLAILLSSYFIYNSVGSIDENALQNLNLVVNLTKHIQIKSSGLNNEDIDPQDFAKYFPSFMWVVRDFTLQLVDQEGDPINAKEYLEKALQAQKGFSESVDQKNRIRRLLKSFFSDRDCVTMIRPLTNEDQLQNLINIPMRDLRPEFVEQVHILRRKVLQRIKPKMINGKNLNGDMFWNLCKSYVDSINQGSIPSIESSWSYICKNECMKALDDAMELFTKTLNDEIQGEGPLYEEELKDKYSSAKRVALQFFDQIAVGEVKEKFLEQLKDKMKQKYHYVKQDNEQSCEQECIMFLRQNYTEIERALKNQDYPRFMDYLQDIVSFKNMFEEAGPPGTNRKEICTDFCFKAVMEAAEFFLGNTINEMNLHKTLAEENIKKLTQQLEESKSEIKERVENLEAKLRRTEIEKAESQAKEQSTKEHLQQIQSEKAQLEQELNGRVTQQKKEFERQIEELTQKMTQAEDNKKDIQRQQIASESEFDKQKALFEQKIEFLEKALEDSNKREKEISVELKNCKKEFLNQNKEQTSHLEKQIKDQNKLIDELKELNYEQETKISDLEIAMEEQKNKLSDELTSKMKELKKNKDSESETQKKLDQLQKKYDQECIEMKEHQQRQTELNEERIVELDSQLKDTKETFDMAKQNWAKEEAVLKQRLEFAQFQLDEEKKKFEENRVANESLLKSLQTQNRESVIGREEFQQRINDMENKFIDERKMLEKQHNETRARLANDLEQMKKKFNELELEYKLKDGEREQENSSLREQLTEATDLKERAQMQLKALETGSMTSSKKLEDDFRLREQELERQIDEKEREIEDLIKEHNETSEQKLHELKTFYDGEKERIERRGLDERARADRKLNNTIEEYEERISEMRNNHEEAMQVLQEEKNYLEHNLLGNQNQIEKENQALQERLEAKERQVAELKDNYNNLQHNSSDAQEKLNEKFTRERKEMNERIDQLASEISKRDRTILSLENQKEGLSNQLQYKEKTLEEMRQEGQGEKSSLIQKLEDLKTKYDQVMDEATQGKINYEREKALKDQKITFQEQRIEDYNNQMKQTIDRYEERLKSEKDDAQKILQERIQRIQQEKENVEKKYEQKRKALKDLEKQIQQIQSQNERENAVQLEKHENLEKQQRELIKNLELDNAKLIEQTEELNEALSKGELGIREEVEQWKIKYYEVERMYSDIQTEFEKDKALWAGKFDFLEKQKEQYKKDNEDQQALFQQTVDQLQRDSKDTKMKHEHNHKSILAQLESKYKKELLEIQEQMHNQGEKHQQIINRLEKENKNLNEKLEVSSKSMITEHGGLEKKLERLIEERDRLTKDLDYVKNERDKKIDEMKKQFDREKELLKQKNQDLQQKSKQIESKQTEMILAHETNRAKWDQEKSFLLSAKEDAIAEQKAIQRKNDNLLKEIERLKEQNKRNTWKYQKPMAMGKMETDNKMLYGVGSSVLNRLNLGGAGQGLSKQDGPGGGVASSQNFGHGTNRSAFGTDKSMDNIKLGFQSKFGAQLGLGQNKVGGPMAHLTVPGSTTSSIGAAAGAVAQPSPALNSNRNQLDNSMRGSNLLDTPSSKGGHIDDE